MFLNGIPQGQPLGASFSEKPTTPPPVQVGTSLQSLTQHHMFTQMSPPLSPTSFGHNSFNHPTVMPLSPSFSQQGYRALSTGHLSPTPLSPHALPVSPAQTAGATSPRQRQPRGACTLQQSGGQKVLIVNLDRYVPPQTNPHETREENNFRHALPPRMLHKHKAWIEQQIGFSAELMLNIPPGLVELSRKRLSRGDSRYKGLSEMKLEARVVGEFDATAVQQLFDDLFVHNKRTVRSSRRRCFEVINSVKTLTESTGAFVISRPVDECVDIYGPVHAVDAAQAYLTSMQSQSGVSKRVIHIKSAAASAVIRQRRNILTRDEGSLFVEPPPRGQLVQDQTVTIYAYSDPGFLDQAENAIRNIEQDVLRRKGDASSPCMSPTGTYDSPPLSPSFIGHGMMFPSDAEQAVAQAQAALAMQQQQMLMQQFTGQAAMDVSDLPPMPEEEPAGDLHDMAELLAPDAGDCEIQTHIKAKETEGAAPAATGGDSPSQSPPPLLDDEHRENATDEGASRPVSRRNSSALNVGVSCSASGGLPTPHFPATPCADPPCGVVSPPGIRSGSVPRHLLKTSLVSSGSSQGLSSPPSCPGPPTPPRSPLLPVQ